MGSFPRIATTVIAAAVALPLTGAAAAASTAQPVVDQSNWFWQEQVGGTVDPLPVPYPAQLPEHTVPEGDLAVAVDPRQASDPKQDPDKETYLSWSLFDVPLKSAVSTFTVTLPLDQEAEGNVFSEPPKLIACLPKQAWSGGDGAEQFAGKPKDDCGDAVAGTFDDSKKSYTFDLTSFAQQWVDGDANNGIAVRHALDYAKPFQVVLLPADKVTAKLAYTPAAAPPTSGSELPTGGGAAPPVVPLDPVGGGGSGVVPGLDPGNLDGAAGPATTTGADPGVAPVTATGRRAPVATRLAAHTKPAIGFWLGVVGGLVLLGLASLSLGDAAVPVAATRPGGGLSRALERRRRTAAAASDAAVEVARGLHP